MHVSSNEDPVETKLKGKITIVVLLANFVGAIIKPKDSHDGLRNQTRLEFLFNRDLFS